MPTVGTLTVDLVAQTATFSGDLGKAAQSAEQFGKSASAAGSQVDYSMMEARGSTALLGEELGVHIPRHLQTLIAEIPGVGAAFSAMLPIVGVVAAIAIIEKLIAKHQEAAAEMSAGWESMRSTFDSTMAGLADKLIEVRIRAAELAGEPLTALRLQLESIDHQTMSGLIQQFKSAEDEADKLLAKMDGNWFTKAMGAVDTGPAQEALGKVGVALAKIRSGSNDPKEAIAVLSQGIVDATTKFDSLADARRKALHVIQYGTQDKYLMDHLTAEEQAWNHVVETLKEQMASAEARVKIGTGEQDNARTAQIQKDGANAQKAAEEQVRLYQLIAKAHEELDKSVEQGADAVSKQVSAQLKAQMDGELKAAKIQADNFGAQLAGIQAVRKAQGELDAAVLKAHGTAERDYVKQQSAESIISKRQEAQELVAIGKSELQEAHAAHQTALDELQQHLKAMQAAQEAAKGGAGEAKATEAATKAQVALTQEGTRFIGVQAQLQAAIKANESEATKLGASWSQYFGKMHMETQDLGTVLKTSLEDNLTKAMDGFANGISKMIVSGKSFGAAMRSVATETAESMISMLIKVGMEDLISTLLRKHSAASLAGANATASMAAAPFPLSAGAPAFGAAMMGAAMGFAAGGTVPGEGYGDTVPAMLSPGETVVSKALTDQVKGNNGSGGGHAIHVYSSPTIHALDADGVNEVLDRHADVIQEHVTKALRKNHARG